MVQLALEALATVCLAVHLWCVNISSAAPLFGTLLAWKSRREKSPILWQESRWLGIEGIITVFAGGLAGLALAGVMWLAGDRGLFEILPRFSYKIKWAAWEIVFYVACMVGYVALSRLRPRKGQAADQRRWKPILQAVLAVLASTNLLYHFPPLFTVMAHAADRPDLVSSSVGPAEFREWLVRGHVVALTAHFLLASLSVGGVTTMHRLARLTPSDEQSNAVARAIRLAAIVTLAASATQLLVGLWVLLSLGPLAQRRLMGGDMVGTLGLAVSVVVTFWLLHRLAHATSATVTRAYARRTMIWLMLIVLLMTMTLRRAERRRVDVGAVAGFARIQLLFMNDPGS